jgi:hypothetical protein
MLSMLLGRVRYEHELTLTWTVISSAGLSRLSSWVFEIVKVQNETLNSISPSTPDLSASTHIH